MKVVVVGGSGNVGLGVVEVLAQRGHRVVVASRGRHPVPRGDRVVHLAVDRADHGRFVDAVHGTRPDAVVDLAAFDAADAESTVRAARDVPRAVLCSSVSVYGRHAAADAQDEDAPLRPSSRYGRAKVAAESAFRNGRGAAGRHGVILRPTLVYGRNVLRRQLGADPSFVDRLRHGKPVLVAQGAGSARFQPLFARDLGYTVLAALEAPRSGTYNVVGPQVVSWTEHHATLARVHRFPRVRLVELPPAVILARPPAWVSGLESRMASRVYSGARAAAELSFVPATPWDQGALDAVAWMSRAGMARPCTGDSWEDDLLARAGP